MTVPDRSSILACVHRPLPAEFRALANAHAEMNGIIRQEWAIHPAHAALLTSAHWAPGTTLRIAFRGGTIADRASVMKAAGEWMLYANIRFVQVDHGPAEVRIAFDQTLGSWSYLGTEILAIPPDEPTANMGWPNDYGRDLHELGHTLGLVHEHQTGAIPWNVPAVLAYYGAPPNSWSEQEIFEQVLDRIDASTLTNGGYDLHSIMEYPIPAELVTDPAWAVGWNQDLSAGDKRFVQTIYPKA